MDYQKAYAVLFNSITDASNALMKSKIITAELEKGIAILREAQLITEDMYISGK